MSILNNAARCGNFTSSEIVALTKRDKSGKGFGAPALTYIEECNFERRLGRSITDESNARPLTWGKLLEPRVNDLLGLQYKFCSDETLVHPRFDCWAGSPDCVNHKGPKAVGDVKCPQTLKSFCQLVQPLYDGLTGIEAINAVRANHKDGEKYYWQLVSNCCITGCDYAELIIYMPYESELEEIKLLAQDGQPKHYWIAMACDGELPFIKDGGYHKNLNVIRFKVPDEDKKALTESVIRAEQLLIPRVTIYTPAEGCVLVERA